MSLPSDLPPMPEVVSMTVWPTIGATRLGRWVGKVCGIRAGYGFFTVGKLFALATVPISLVLYFWKVLPYVGRRYRLTNRRVVIQKALPPADLASIDLDQFDAVQIEVLPGQAWLRSGELLFVRQGQEVFRLSGVPWPEGFRRTCLKAQAALLAVREVLRQQQPPQPAAM
jgi:hypothetical protein